MHLVQMKRDDGVLCVIDLTVKEGSPNDRGERRLILAVDVDARSSRWLREVVTSLGETPATRRRSRNDKNVSNSIGTSVTVTTLDAVQLGV